MDALLMHSLDIFKISSDESYSTVFVHNKTAVYDIVWRKNGA